MHPLQSKGVSKKQSQKSICIFEGEHDIAPSPVVFCVNIGVAVDQKSTNAVIGVIGGGVKSCVLDSLEAI